MERGVGRGNKRVWGEGILYKGESESRGGRREYKGVWGEGIKVCGVSPFSTKRYYSTEFFRFFC